MKFAIAGNVGNSRGKSKYLEPILAKGMLMFVIYSEFNVISVQNISKWLFPM
jgi:hypothetical protein